MAKEKKWKKMKWFKTEGDKKRGKDRNKKKTTETGWWKPGGKRNEEKRKYNCHGNKNKNWKKQRKRTLARVKGKPVEQVAKVVLKLLLCSKKKENGGKKFIVRWYIPMFCLEYQWKEIVPLGMSPLLFCCQTCAKNSILILKKTSCILVEIKQKVGAKNQNF